MIRSLSLILPVLFGTGFFLEAAPRRYDDDIKIVVKELQDSIDDLRREVRNHELEISTLSERALTQDDKVDHLKREVHETYQAQKDLVKNHSSSSEGKLGQIEATQKGVIADLKQIKSHSSETQELLKIYKEKLSELEKGLSSLTSRLEGVQNALTLVMDLVKPTGGQIYRVKAGDTLEKIAKAHKTSIKALKEHNQLQKDQITVGQPLKIPES